MAHTSLASLFSDIADAIRAKTGGSSQITADDFPTAIAAIPSGGGGSATIEELDVSASGTYTASGGVDGYSPVVVPAGTEGTPTASKGSVSNHAITVTPSVTNSAGYISGGTKTGTGVSVTAAELVSGSETKTANGTYDVTNLAELVVNVGGKNIQAVLGSAYGHTNAYANTGMSITVAKAGTYKVSWAGWRSSSQGTMGSNLYVNGSAGTNQQTFTSTYGQCITLENQSYNKNDVLTLYANAGSTSRYMYVANLIIEEQ